MGFNILLQNIRSIQKTFDELEVFLHHLDTKPHIIALTETWTSEKNIKRIISADSLLQVDNLW